MDIMMAATTRPFEENRILAPLVQFSRMRIDTRTPDMRVLYVAMATWVPHCNMAVSTSPLKDRSTSISTESNRSLDDDEFQYPQPEVTQTRASLCEDNSDVIEKEHNLDETPVEDIISSDLQTEDDKTSGEEETKVQEQLENSTVEMNPKDESNNDSDDSDNDQNDCDSDDVKNETDANKIDNSGEIQPAQATSKAVEALKTPQKTLSPKQLQKKLESEKKKAERLREREEKERKRLEEKNEKLKARQEKEDLRLKEKEMKQKEKELKLKEREDEKNEREKRKREKEEMEKAKRLEREQEKLKRQQEIEKMEEKKLKAAAAFANFFVAAKKSVQDEVSDEVKRGFMPFEVKSDMRLAPVRRRCLTDEQKTRLMRLCEEQNPVIKSYVAQLRSGEISALKSWKTWLPDEDVVLVLDEGNLGESIEEETRQRIEKMRVKFLKFHENRRPPYYGTWRKKSAKIGARRPFAQDDGFLNYELDSDEEWEEEVDGESLRGSDAEDEANDVDNEYEVDNQVFVQHGYLSEDEVDGDAAFDPETHKAKLKLLRNQFEEERREKTRKLKPRVIGCVWMERAECMDDALREHLEQFAVLADKREIRARRGEAANADVPETRFVELEGPRLARFVRAIHGNVRSRKQIVSEFWENLATDAGDFASALPSKVSLSRQMKRLAAWKKSGDGKGGKFCWCVDDDVLKEHVVAEQEQ